MTARIRIIPSRAARAAAVALPVLLAGCNGGPDFDIRSQEGFVSSCVSQSGTLAARMNAVRATYSADPATIALLFAAYADPFAKVEIQRDFNPMESVPIVGQDRLNEQDPIKSCASVARHADRFANVPAIEALRMGLGSVISSLSTQMNDSRRIRRDILTEQAKMKTEAARLREAMTRYPPRGVTFRIVSKNGRFVPSVVINVANIVGKPITAFVFNLRLVASDGASIGAGRVKFEPPVPLGPGIESTYVLDLGGVRGIDTKDVLSFSGAVRVVVGLDDLVVEGKPLLEALVVSASDRSRVNALSALEDSILRLRDRIRAIRERQIAAFG